MRGKTYIVLTESEKPANVFSKPHGNARMMHRQRMLVQIAVQIWPYRLCRDKRVVVQQTPIRQWGLKTRTN